MHAIDSSTLLRGKQPLPGLHYLFDTLLALLGTMGVTGIIFTYHLYPRIPNISIIYLLVVLPLAVTRGRYSAMLASVLAFLSFDFFIVPPLYTFVMYHIEEWIALFIFLINALLTGQLAAALRQRADESARRERETRALYHLARAANRVEDTGAQLHAISRAVVATFSSWGVQDCAILQPDANGVLQVQVSASQSTGDVPLWQDQSASVSGGRQRMLRTIFAWIAPAFPIVRSAEKRTPDHSLHLVPLKLLCHTASQAIGSAGICPLSPMETLWGRGARSSSCRDLSGFMGIHSLSSTWRLRWPSIRFAISQIKSISKQYQMRNASRRSIVRSKVGCGNSMIRCGTSPATDQKDHLYSALTARRVLSNTLGQAAKLLDS